MQSPKEYQKCINVDAAGIKLKKMFLPGEVSTTTSWLGREVSRCHSNRYPDSNNEGLNSNGL
ncbi:hypothetical protein [Maribacter sp. ACAM166]|uniref:hypothetical protein n=1 Tax=Maribacter sp. ACAM166 TaxID=2508996 RepID=UPI0010FE4924|nr:hypothetical protein [Maribacter sp. ACAM166]TLP70530.1 hypothetical protein ES765_21010 [Maribacter sp. ACAM166]